MSEGYGLVQPRVGMSLPGAHRSRFAELYSAGTGIDPYAGAVSDTYQDVFGEGSFTGKGIFEVDVFSGVLEDRFPENTLLSHDLIEGAFLRTGLASDIEVLDDYPANYLAQHARMHRWVRGDWQTLAVAGPDGSATRTGVLRANPLSSLHRWKIFDNLRRSLVAPATVLLFALGWLLLPHACRAGGRSFLLLIVFFPAYFSLARLADLPAPRGDALDIVRAGILARLRRATAARGLLYAAAAAAPGVGDDRRHRPRRVAHARLPQAPARVGDRRRGREARPVDDARAFWRAMGPASAVGIALLADRHRARAAAPRSSALPLGRAVARRPVLRVVGLAAHRPQRGARAV